MTMSEITLKPVQSEDMPAFKDRLQDAFTQASIKAFPFFPEVIPPERDIDEALSNPGAEALQFICDNKYVGGAIVSGDDLNKSLDFIFIDSEIQDKHLGSAAWNALESHYPQVEKWELVTPYHERRNIHFYINKCGFCITEYYNDYHPDPHFPQEEAGDYPGEDGGVFKFEKVMKRDNA